MTGSIIIVGAGISGLAAGCYARMNGYDCTILEMHSLPGGLCAAWERKGYKWDISMHMLTASAGGPLHEMWKELGIPQNFKIHYHDINSLVEGTNEKLLWTAEKNILEANMLKISPEDKKLIREFVDLIFGADIMKAASLKPKKFQTIFDTIKILPVILPLVPKFIRYNKVTLQDFAARFKHPFLQEAVRFFIDAPGWPMPRFPMSAMAGFVRSGITEAGTPLGGSNQVMRHMAEYFQHLGGTIRYKSRVTDLIIEDDTVTGVRLNDSAVHRADHVIWAGDGHNLIFNILKGKYLNDRIRTMYDSWIPVKPILHVMLGVDMDFSQEPHRIIFKPGENITIAGKNHDWIAFLHHCFDPSAAPKGKSAVEVWFDTEYDYWEKLAADKQKYNAEKKRIANCVIAELDRRWPGFAERVEVVDVPTPVTYTRYTGTWKGSPDGWYVTPENINEMEPIRTLPGLKGLQMTGQWTMPFTGTVMAALTGRQAIQLLCRENKKRFRNNIKKD